MTSTTANTGASAPVRLLLGVTDTVAAVLLAADLAVVIGSVTLRSLFNAPVEWSDDVARGLMVGSSFFGAASALARGENAGVAFFVDRVPSNTRRIVDAVTSLLVLIIAAYVAFHAIELGMLTTGQTTGSGLPLELTFYPMGVGAACMTAFALDQFVRRSVRDIALALAIVGGADRAVAWVERALAWTPCRVPAPLMLIGFVISLAGGMAIGFALALAALIYIWAEGALPGVIFAQQMARGIDNFVLLAIPFFILVGYLMEANGMSVRLIALLERMVGRMRGGLNVVMVLSMVIFSGISGSKMADVAAVGSVLIPAARRSRQNPGNAVALLAASAVMAEAIPPCINLIILGFVANLSIGGLFMAGIVPADPDGARADRGRDHLRGAQRHRRQHHGACSNRAALERRRRDRRVDRADLRRLQVGVRDRDGDLRLCGALRAGGRRPRVPRTRLARGGAQLHAVGGPLRADHVHRRGERNRSPSC